MESFPGAAALHTASGVSPFQAQIWRELQDESLRFSPSSDSAMAGWPCSTRAASSLAMAALADCRLRSRESSSDVTTKFANWPANR